MYADLVFRDLKDNDDTVRFTVIQDGASDENIDSMQESGLYFVKVQKQLSHHMLETSKLISLILGKIKFGR